MKEYCCGNPGVRDCPGVRAPDTSTPGFGRIANVISALRLPTVIVQEGGYLCDALGDNLAAFLTGFNEAKR